MLVEKLKKRGHLRSESLKKAFLKIDRKDFVPESQKKSAYEDRPLTIGEGQTISQPSVVAFMLEKLSPKRGDNVLDIGSGSGWTTALLAEIVGTDGKVTALERIEELKKTGERNVRKYSFIEKEIAEFICKDGYRGHFQNGPYDKILVSAALEKRGDLSQEWIEQLKSEGVIVVPIGDSIYKFKKEEDDLTEEKYFGFRFVPLIKENE